MFRMARLIESAFDRREVGSAEAPNARSPLRRSASRLVGSRLVAAESRGKHLILDFSVGLAIHAHMGMVGSWQVSRPGESRRRRRSAAWLVLGLRRPGETGNSGIAGSSEGGDDLQVAQFGGPTLRLVRRAELNRDSRLARLGPDLLDSGLSIGTAAERLAAAGPAELGEALLDQTVLAGIGNIFKSEACLEAGVDPWRPVESFDREQIEELVAIVAAQLRRGAETGRRPGRIYRKAGRPCPRCGGPIRSRGQGLDNRITYWCPRCQT